MSPPDRPKRIDTLFAEYRGRVGRFLRTKSVVTSEVPDLTQEVFLRMLRASDAEEIRNPEAYLFTIARNLTQEHHEKRSQAPVHVDLSELFLTEELIARDDPLQAAVTQQRFEHLERLLAPMRPKVALAFVLHRLGGYRIGEIAAEMGLAKITIKKYLAEATRELRAHDASRGTDAP